MPVRITSSKYDLFGSDYAGVNGGNDKGTTILESQLAAQTLNRIRKVYAATVQVRNLCYVDSTRGNLCSTSLMNGETVKNMMKPTFVLLRRQDGAALIVSLMMLIVVLILSIALATVSLQGEKASRSDRDRQIALMAAEAALKDAEMDIDPQVASANGRANLFDPTSNLYFEAGCASGDGTSIRDYVCLHWLVRRQCGLSQI
jgi:hypothetical protein